MGLNSSFLEWFRVVIAVKVEAASLIYLKVLWWMSKLAWFFVTIVCILLVFWNGNAVFKPWHAFSFRSFFFIWVLVPLSLKYSERELEGPRAWKEAFTQGLQILIVGRMSYSTGLFHNGNKMIYERKNTPFSEIKLLDMWKGLWVLGCVRRIKLV